MSYRMKKICALLCVATLMGSLSACSTTNALSAVKNNTETESAAAATSSQLDASEMFTDRDKEIGYDDTSAISIELSDSSASCDSKNVTIDGSTVTITQEGTYVLSGTLSDGQIVVDADDAKVQLVLNGVDITNKSSAAIYVKSADKVFVTLADGTENKLTTSGTFETDDDNNIDAVVFSKDDITFNGKGSLTVSTENGNGITSKDDLKITGGTYNITVSGHGLEGKDSVRIADGTITITSGKDGIHSDNTDDTGKGFVYIAGGKLDITSTGDGIDASNIVQVDDGEVNIVSGGGSANSTKTHNMGPGGGPGGEKPSGEKPSGEKPSGEKPSGDMPNGEKPSGEAPSGEKPSGEKPSGEAPSGEKPSDMPDAGNSENDTNSTTDSASNNKSVSTDKSTSDSSDTASTKGIKADNNLYINGGTFDVDSADDSFHTNAAMTVSGGTFTISSGDDAMHADGTLLVTDGSIDISKCYEGLEGITVTVDGGDIKIVSSDDGINAAGDDTSVSNLIEINGGTIYVNAEGDGIDSNGDIKINGGTLTIDGPANDGNSAIDIGDGANGYINGGTVIAIGCAGMVEEFDTSSEQAMINVQVSDDNISGDVVLTDSEGNEIISYTPAKSYDCVQISSSLLKTGETYTLKAGDTTTSISLDNTIYSNITRSMHPGA